LTVYTKLGENGKSPTKGVTFEFHIDIGKRGETKALINEMVGMVSGLNFIPKIKPDSYCASCLCGQVHQSHIIAAKSQSECYFLMKSEFQILS